MPHFNAVKCVWIFWGIICFRCSFCLMDKTLPVPQVNTCHHSSSNGWLSRVYSFLHQVKFPLSLHGSIIRGPRWPSSGFGGGHHRSSPLLPSPPSLSLSPPSPSLCFRWCSKFNARIASVGCRYGLACHKLPGSRWFGKPCFFAYLCINLLILVPIIYNVTIVAIKFLGFTRTFSH